MTVCNMPRPAAVFVIDIGKNVFPVIRLDEAGRPIQRTRCRRDTLLQFFDGAQAAVVGMEAGAGSQWLARKLQACGHTVGIIPAEFVKPYIKSNKNDVIACWPRENYTRRVWVWEVTCF